jgi:hypothetical protein
MMSHKILLASGAVLMALAAIAQQPVSTPPAAIPTPKVATTIPATGIHLVSEIGAFKIKRGSEAQNYGLLDITFKGTVLVSGLKGTVTPSKGAFLAFPQPKYNKKVYFSKGIGNLKVFGQFGGIQFFGQNVNAYYRGDGVIQLFGEFDKNLNTGFYWYDQTPSDKQFWGTSGRTITPTPYVNPQLSPGGIKIKDVTGKS